MRIKVNDIVIVKDLPKEEIILWLKRLDFYDGINRRNIDMIYESYLRTIGKKYRITHISEYISKFDGRVYKRYNHNPYMDNTTSLNLVFGDALVMTLKECKIKMIREILKND